MRRVFVHERLGWVTGEKFRDDEQPDFLLAVKGFLKYVATIAVGCKLDDATTGDKIT
jgi:hypothetical protein